MTTIGRYKLLEEIGIGGTATVYRAKDEYNDYAVKILHTYLATDPVIRERFRREATISRKLKHPGIVNIFDVIDWDNVPALVMEYCTGGNLFNWKPISIDAIVSMMIQIAHALHAAHQAGIIHRDLKPQNILITEKGSIKICDFGSARLQNLVGITTTSMFMGTPQYVPPETFDGTPADPRTDLYALGAIVYEMWTGKSHLNRPLNMDLSPESYRICSLQLQKSDTPEWFDSLVTRLLGPIEQRPLDASSLITILENKHFSSPLKKKKCLFCKKEMPMDSTLCLACGKRELYIVQKKDLYSTSVVLKKITEKAETLEAFRELLHVLSGQSEIRLNLLIGDSRLYSKEEQKSLRKLPTTILNGLTHEMATALVQIFNELEGVTTKVYYDNRVPKAARREPLITTKQAIKSGPIADNVLATAVKHVQKIKQPPLRSLFSEFFLACYRVVRNIELKALMPNLEEIFKDLRIKTHNLLERLEEIDFIMKTIQFGHVYTEIIRIERQIEQTSDSEICDRLMMKKTEQMQLFQKYQTLEQEYSRIIGRVLTVQGKMTILAERLNVIVEKEKISKSETDEIAQALEELDRFLD